MTRLSGKTLPAHIRSFRYDRANVVPGIVHFGIGNFHRAHQAVYCDDLLEKGDMRWGITGVSLRSSSMRDALKPQDYLYTLATLGEHTEYRVIGAIKNVLVAHENPQAVIDAVARSATHLVSVTITEKGYCLASGSVDFSQTDLQTELLSLQRPKTVYGYIARAIIQRAQLTDGNAKLTIMSCDNISAGGDLLKEGVERLLKQHNKYALAWSQAHVGFVSSMVDRVSPATGDALRNSVLHHLQLEDAWPVSTETFRQWIIEDKFSGERPDFHHVGAVFVEDIIPFEKMKLRILNAAHSMIAALGYLYGDAFVHETLKRSEVLIFIREALYNDVLPNIVIPSEYDGSAYIESVITRFQNTNLPYANLQVCTDSSQKIQHRWFPTIDHAIEKKKDCTYFEFCLGVWAMFIQSALDNSDLIDPNLSQFDKVDKRVLTPMIEAYLIIANADRFSFYHQENLFNHINQCAEHIKVYGISIALNKFLESKE